LLFGFDTAVISGTTRALAQLYELTPGMLGWTVSAALWGTVLGSILAGLPGDRFGRRDSLRLMAALFFVSAAGCAVAWDWYSLVIFRFIGGLGVGGASVLGPMYIAEIAPAAWRGRLVGFFQLNVVFGILVAYLSNYAIGLFDLGDAEWRWKLGIEAAPAALFFLLLFGIPRSPRWLVQKQRIEEARAVLVATGEPNVDEELRDIVQSIDVEHGHATESRVRDTGVRVGRSSFFVPRFLAYMIR
jgi:MFS family permease